MTHPADRLRLKIRDVPDYPRDGVLFKDITPLLADPESFATATGELARAFEGEVDKVAGIEARGLILAAPIAHHLKAGFVPVRKAGKLPGPVHAQTYELEYGQGTLEVQQGAFEPGDRVLVVDDVLATGGTAQAALRLLAMAGAVPVGLAVLIDLGFPIAQGRLDGIPLRSLLNE